jgi:hypothetical protein
MKLLIAILGAHTQPEQMQAQRETWFMDCPCDYLYFLGEPYTDASAEDMPDIFRIEGFRMDRTGKELPARPTCSAKSKRS